MNQAGIPFKSAVPVFKPKGPALSAGDDPEDAEDAVGGNWNEVDQARGKGIRAQKRGNDAFP